VYPPAEESTKSSPFFQEVIRMMPGSKRTGGSSPESLAEAKNTVHFMNRLFWPFCLRLPTPANRGNGHFSSPISHRPENAGDDPYGNTEDSERPKPILGRKMHNRSACNHQGRCRTKIRQKSSLIRQESPINRKLIPQDQVAVVELRRWRLLHAFLPGVPRGGFGRKMADSHGPLSAYLTGDRMPLGVFHSDPRPIDLIAIQKSKKVIAGKGKVGQVVKDPGIKIIWEKEAWWHPL